ncbi:MAG: thiamine phosphate synthase [Nitratireductor sp.]
MPLLINDRGRCRSGFAGADGVHLGQSDMQADQARALLGPNAIIGLSVGSAAEYAASCNCSQTSIIWAPGPIATRPRPMLAMPLAKQASRP